MLKLFIFIYLIILGGNEDMWTLLNLEILLRNGNSQLNYKIMVIILLLMTTEGILWFYKWAKIGHLFSHPLLENVVPVNIIM